MSEVTEQQGSNGSEQAEPLLVGIPQLTQEIGTLHMEVAILRREVGARDNRIAKLEAQVEERATKKK